MIRCNKTEAKRKGKHYRSIPTGKVGRWKLCCPYGGQVQSLKNDFKRLIFHLKNGKVSSWLVNNWSNFHQATHIQVCLLGFWLLRLEKKKIYITGEKSQNLSFAAYVEVILSKMCNWKHGDQWWTNLTGKQQKKVKESTCRLTQCSQSHPCTAAQQSMQVNNVG